MPEKPPEDLEGSEQPPEGAEPSIEHIESEIDVESIPTPEGTVDIAKSILQEEIDRSKGRSSFGSGAVWAGMGASIGANIPVIADLALRATGHQGLGFSENYEPIRQSLMYAGAAIAVSGVGLVSFASRKLEKLQKKLNSLER